ncbi:glycosyltransferase family 2 protein [Pedobacter sp. AW1-32]|uniref:glycosyltransferase family 2 protein n=1 Tax=Pedobacter sp. AW1-32 TaxID=3383026 RepID=UPI003FEF17BF
MSSSDSPLISIALCTYNGERYLMPQLNSLLNQSYKNIEIIIVDDGSTDRTREIISEFALKNSLIQIHFNTETIGFNKNFEKAIRLSKGDYISICDQDDVWDLNKIEELLGNIGSKGLIFSNSRLMNENGGQTDKLFLETSRFVMLDYKSLLINNYVTGHSILVSRHLMEKALPFPSHGYYDWWLGFIATYYNEIIYLDKPLTNYRIHQGSVIQQEINAHNPDPFGISMMNYKSSTQQLENFKHFLKKSNEEIFVKNLTSLFSLKTNFLEKTWLLVFLYYNYNILFPLHKKRKGISLTRYKFVKKYFSDLLKCKQKALGFN